MLHAKKCVEVYNNMAACLLEKHPENFGAVAALRQKQKDIEEGPGEEHKKLCDILAMLPKGLADIFSAEDREWALHQAGPLPPPDQLLDEVYNMLLENKVDELSDERERQEQELEKLNGEKVRQERQLAAMGNVVRELRLQLDAAEAEAEAARAEAEAARAEAEAARRLLARKTCSACGQVRDTKRCGRCRGPRYCSAECQRAHWFNGHREECH